MRYFMSNLQIRRHLLRFISSGGKCETCANGESCACLASLPTACDCFLRSPRHRLVLAFACVKSVRSVSHRKFYLKAFLFFQFYLDFWSAFRLNFFKCKLKPMTNGSCSIVAQKVGGSKKAFDIEGLYEYKLRSASFALPSDRRRKLQPVITAF